MSLETLVVRSKILGFLAPDYMIYMGEKYRILKNHLGSPRLVVRVSDGFVAQKLSYGTWGEIVEDSNPGFQPYGFAGGIYDPDTKKVNFAYRDYDPTLGRWMSKDPLLFRGGDTNLYGYVSNDPINFIDPSGLTKEDFYAALGWLATAHPELFENINPSYILTKLGLPEIFGVYGITLSTNWIILDMDLLDKGICEGSAERISQYVDALYHELAHAEDIFRVGALEFFTDDFYLRKDDKSRHEEIYERAAVIKKEFEKSQ